MTLFQKVIKYVAIALALGLIVSIFSGILSVIGVLGFLGNSDAVAENLTQYSVSGEVTALKVEIHAADFTVEEADSFFVESNLKQLTVTEEKGVLIIREKDSILKNYNGAVLKIGIPKDFLFASVRIETGAGKVDIATLSAERLALELGAGEVQINSLNASKEAEIEGGAGKITVSGGTLRDLELEMGAGQLNLTSMLLGSSELNLGVGETNLTLLGTAEDYKVSVEKGVGSATVDGQKIDNDKTCGSGENRVELEGGVGAIHVSFQKTES